MVSVRLNGTRNYIHIIYITSTFYESKITDMEIYANEIIIGGIGIVSTVVSGFTSWFFAKKKYYAEVDNTLITNMQQSLDFYKTLVEDNKQRLGEVLERNASLEKRDEALEEEIRQLKNQMFTLMNQICLNLQCELRQKQLKIDTIKKK